MTIRGLPQKLCCAGSFTPSQKRLRSLLIELSACMLSLIPCSRLNGIWLLMIGTNYLVSSGPWLLPFLAQRVHSPRFRKLFVTNKRVANGYASIDQCMAFWSIFVLSLKTLPLGPLELWSSFLTPSQLLWGPVMPLELEWVAFISFLSLMALSFPFSGGIHFLTGFNEIWFLRTILIVPSPTAI